METPGFWPGVLKDHFGVIDQMKISSANFPRRVSMVISSGCYSSAPLLPIADIYLNYDFLSMV